VLLFIAAASLNQNGAHAASSTMTNIGCMLINEAFIDGKPAVIPIPTINLLANTASDAQLIMHNDALSIELKTAGVLETSLNKPFVSQFLVQVEYQGLITTVKSAPRNKVDDDFSIHLNLRNAKGELTLECFSQ
jgi:hypothetical protein